MRRTNDTTKQKSFSPWRALLLVGPLLAASLGLLVAKAQAADAWRELATLPRCAASLRREAREALAIHYEHRSRNLDVARQHALELLADLDANHARVRHRLDRLERKLARSTATLPLHD